MKDRQGTRKKRIVFLLGDVVTHSGWRQHRRPVCREQEGKNCWDRMYANRRKRYHDAEQEVEFWIMTECPNYYSIKLKDKGYTDTSEYNAMY